MAEIIKEIQRRTGEGFGAITLAYARLAMGPGKISFRDFLALRLFDPALRANADLNEFVGQRRNRDLCVAINYRHDWHGLLSNKVAALSFLAAYGFPTLRFEAIYAPGIAAKNSYPAASGGASILRDREALADFLAAARYPLFGKPAEGLQSLGAAALRALSPDRKNLEKSDGSLVPLEAFAVDVATHYAAGYVFQPMALPHEKIAALCGPKLACVRLVTGLTESGPQILRGCWKVPTGANVADNYWRPGNLLASLDLTEGRIPRVVSGAGFAMAEHRAHPDTGAKLIGFAHPEWDSMKALAVEGARLMRHVPLIGWDIACTDRGPVIVEMNEAPDFFLPQIADGRGMYDESFRRFEQFQLAASASFAREAKDRIAKL